MTANATFSSGDSPQQPSFPLGLAAPGELIEVVAIQGSEKLQKRMASMGLRPGIQLEALQNEQAGGLVVRVGETRLALGAAMLHKVQVIKVSGRG